MKNILLAISNLLASWADPTARLCYICFVAITNPKDIVRDHHLCSECHALTRDLAKRRRKERGTRIKDRIKQTAVTLGISQGEVRRLIGAGHITLMPGGTNR